jgi:hypothetical protein
LKEHFYTECSFLDNKDNNEVNQLNLGSLHIPGSAIKAYLIYHGDADKAWDAQDKVAWALIREWKPFIEVKMNRSTNSEHPLDE